MQWWKIAIWLSSVQQFVRKLISRKIWMQENYFKSSTFTINGIFWIYSNQNLREINFGPTNYHFDHFSGSEFWIFENFRHFHVWNSQKSISKLLKLQALTFWNQPTLISRKIRVGHTVLLTFILYNSFFLFLQNQLASLMKTADNLKIKGLSEVSTQDQSSPGALNSASTASSVASATSLIPTSSLKVTNATPSSSSSSNGSGVSLSSGNGTPSSPKKLKVLDLSTSAAAPRKTLWFHVKFQ